MMMAMHRGQTVDLGPEVPMPGPAPMFPARETFYDMYYGSPPVRGTVKKLARALTVTR